MGPSTRVPQPEWLACRAPGCSQAASQPARQQLRPGCIETSCNVTYRVHTVIFAGSTVPLLAISLPGVLWCGRVCLVAMVLWVCCGTPAPVTPAQGMRLLLSARALRCAQGRYDTICYPAAGRFWCGHLQFIAAHCSTGTQGLLHNGLCSNQYITHHATSQGVTGCLARVVKGPTCAEHSSCMHVSIRTCWSLSVLGITVMF